MDSGWISLKYFTVQPPQKMTFQGRHDLRIPEVMIKFIQTHDIDILNLYTNHHQCDIRMKNNAMYINQ
jgi:hypothetical protein